MIKLQKKRKEQTMEEKTDFIVIKEKIDFIAILEEYKQLFNNFFCDPKPRSVKVEGSFAIVEELDLLSEKKIELPTFTLYKNELQIKFKESVNFAINTINLRYIYNMKKDKNL